MKNPFIQVDKEINCEYLTEDCSINKMIIRKLPIHGIADEIEGYNAGSVFNACTIINEIKRNADILEIDLNEYRDVDLPKMLNVCLLSDKESVRIEANRIANKFGNILALILLTLKLGEKENKAMRPEWSDEHWAFWEKVKSIVIVGGIASDEIGKRFKLCINNIFNACNLEAPTILLCDNSAYAGVMGCTKLIKKPDSKNIVFDFGQTNIKRSIITKSGGTVSNVQMLTSYESHYTNCSSLDSEDILQQAQRLHEHVVEVICKTYWEVSKQVEISDEMVISIANYVVNGKICAKRGGYAKLFKLGENYENILNADVRKALNKPINIKIIHDGTAMALFFSDIEDSVCISIGTAFGVGFPDMKII